MRKLEPTVFVAKWFRKMTPELALWGGLLGYIKPRGHTRLLLVRIPVFHNII